MPRTANVIDIGRPGADGCAKRTAFRRAQNRNDWATALGQEGTPTRSRANQLRLWTSVTHGSTKSPWYRESICATIAAAFSRAVVILRQPEPFRFSTDDVSPQEGLGALRALRDRGILPIEPLRTRQFTSTLPIGSCRGSAFCPGRRRTPPGGNAGREQR